MDSMEESKLIVHNLPSDFTTERLYELFESYGEIVEGDFKWGIGFVCFAEAEAAEAAFTSKNETKIDSKTIKIDFPGRKIPIDRLIVKNLPTSEYTSEELKELFEAHGQLSECEYKWGYGFIKFAEEKSMADAMKALKGKELANGKKIFFEVQGPDGEPRTSSGSNGCQKVEDDEMSILAKIGPVCLFIGNLKDGTTAEEVKEIVEEYGETKKVEVKNNFSFVHFKETDACHDCLKRLSKKTINGVHPRVQYGEIKRGGKVFCGNLNEDVDQDELISTFMKFGSIVEYKFVRQFAFFTFDDTAEAMRAVKELNNKTICGIKVKVAVSTADKKNDDGEACHNCGSPGHYSRNCPSKLGGGGDRKENWTCHKCGETGHISKECPAKLGLYGGPSRVRSRSPRRESYGYADYPADYPAYHRGGRR